MAKIVKTKKLLVVVTAIAVIAAVCIYNMVDDRGGNLSDVENALAEMMKAGGMVTLVLSTESGEFNSYVSDVEEFTEYLKPRLYNFQWKTMKAHEEDGEYAVTVSAADGIHRMIFYGDGTVAYFDGNSEVYWRAEFPDDPAVSFSTIVRDQYNSLDCSYERIVFSFDGSADAAAEEFAYNAYGSHLLSLVPGNDVGIREYEVIDWEVMEISSDDAAVVGGVSYAFVPVNPNSGGIWAGNTREGTGEYEGMLTASRQFVLEKLEDGYWHCTGLGTGGYRLPEKYL